MNNFKKINEELTLEILWRYKELKNIKLLYYSNVNKRIIRGIEKYENTFQSKYILRSSIPMIYAHWEGFFKKAIEILNEELDKLNIDLNRLDNMLLANLLKDKHSIKYKDKDLKFINILVDTESNLSWKVIEKFTHRYNFNIKVLQKYKSIIEQLLKARNGISHGENSYHYDSFDKIDEYIITVIKLMILHKNNVLNCIKYKTYYKNDEGR